MHCFAGTMMEHYFGLTQIIVLVAVGQILIVVWDE